MCLARLRMMPQVVPMEIQFLRLPLQRSVEYPPRFTYSGCTPFGARTMNEILNVGLFVFHTSWIAFNCLGWLWRRTRRWQLATVSLTALSWFGLGIWYGWGYCPCTDWHWQVRARLGYDDPPSYIQLLIRELTGMELSSGRANALALATLAAAAVLSLVLNLQDQRDMRADPWT